VTRASLVKLDFVAPRWANVSACNVESDDAAGMATKRKAGKATKARTGPSVKKKLIESKSLEWARESGIETDSPKKRAEVAAKSTKHPLYRKTRAAVLATFRECYPSDDDDEPESDDEILETDPNDYDADPSTFYEIIEERFGVAQDPSNQYFGGFGGPVRDLISFLTTRWDGTLRRTTEETAGEDED